MTVTRCNGEAHITALSSSLLDRLPLTTSLRYHPENPPLRNHLDVRLYGHSSPVSLTMFYSLDFCVNLLKFHATDQYFHNRMTKASNPTIEEAVFSFSVEISFNLQVHPNKWSVRPTSDTLHYANRLVNWILNLEESIRRKVSRMIEHLGWHAPCFNGGQSSGTFDRSLIERSYQ